MEYILEINGERKVRDFGDNRTLATILTDNEYDKVSNGELVPFQNGGLMNLSSKLDPNQEYQNKYPIELLQNNTEEVKKRLRGLFGEGIIPR